MRVSILSPRGLPTPVQWSQCIFTPGKKGTRGKPSYTSHHPSVNAQNRCGQTGCDPLNENDHYWHQQDKCQKSFRQVKNSKYPLIIFYK
jgi:hypothetical protein